LCGADTGLKPGVNENSPFRTFEAKLSDAADSDPLVGMALLDGYELRIQVVNGGDVAMEVLS
jgi:hypothetical protein